MLKDNTTEEILSSIGNPNEIIKILSGRCSPYELWVYDWGWIKIRNNRAFLHKILN